MKHTIAIFFTVLFLVFNAGVVLNIHLCHDRVESVTLQHKDGCATPGKACCKDFSYQLSIDTDFVATVIDSFDGLDIFSYAIETHSITPNVDFLKVLAPFMWRAVPNLPGRIYLVHRQLLI